MTKRTTESTVKKENETSIVNRRAWMKRTGMLSRAARSLGTIK